MPHFVQANFSEKRRSSPSSGEIFTMPSASLAASSIESVRRWRMPSFFTRRSTNTSIVCALSAASLGGSASSASSPSMLARTNPSWRSLARTSANAPFCSRTTGASTEKRAPSGSSSTRSTICWIVCDAIGCPQL